MDRIDVQVLNYSKSPEKLPRSTYSRRAMARLYSHPKNSPVQPIPDVPWHVSTVGFPTVKLL
ncbi:hypothetical protein [Coleofasciculus chthonoplastes]|uniref:hypothetical protein n=1 Tax=Coleofasciculus chthonoplastes TaxID=64178 RepID=UPI0040640B7A